MNSGDPRFCESPWADSRWVAVESAVNGFVNLMNTTRAAEHIAVVTFASDYAACATTSQSATLDQPLTADLSQVTSTMSTLTSSIWNGMTEISVGMGLGRNELIGDNSRDTAQKIMIVLTDGAYTNGIHPSGEATAAAAEGIQVHTITFGAVPQTVLDDMHETALAGGGVHYHAPDAATLNEVFVDIAGSIAILIE
jgi:Mg-chelatase subunit ChlD